MGVPGEGGGGKGAKPAALAVAQGMNMDTLGGGHVPDRFDQLFVFVTPLRPPVYSTPADRVVDETCTVVWKVYISQGMSKDGVT